MQRKGGRVVDVRRSLGEDCAKESGSASVKITGFGRILTIHSVLDGVCCNNDAVISLGVTGFDFALQHHSRGVLCGMKRISQ